MPCYHPMIAIPTEKLTKNGKLKYRFLPNDIDKNPIQKLKENPGAILVPCGHCIGCRLDYSRKWADRMMLELETAKKGIFLTLTYDDLHAIYTKVDVWQQCPCGLVYPIKGNTTVSKRDAQLFMKRFRKEFNDFRVRFFMCAEYGSNTLRAHMHYIIFGVGLDDIGDITTKGVNKFGNQYYISKRIRNIWKNGNILVADVSWKTCAYVSRYITKKQYGANAIDYVERDVEPEFCLMSRKPGIGAEYLFQFPDALDYQCIYVSTPDGGKKINLPKYYLQFLKKESENNFLYNPGKYDKIMLERRLFAQDRMLLELQNTDKSFSEYLETKEEEKLRSFKKLDYFRTSV